MRCRHPRAGTSDNRSGKLACGAVSGCGDPAVAALRRVVSHDVRRLFVRVARCGKNSSREFLEGWF